MLPTQPQEDSDGGTQGAEGTAEAPSRPDLGPLTCRPISSPTLLHCSDTHLVGPLGPMKVSRGDVHPPPKPVHLPPSHSL